MKVTPVEDPDLLQHLGYAADQPRTLGVLHLSDIYKRLMIRLQPKRFKPGPFVMNNHVEIGILFESILEEALARKFSTVRPGELVLPMSSLCPTCGCVLTADVYMSPDGVNPALCAGEEYKATFMSCRHGLIDEYDQPLAKFEHWFFQMKGYAKALDILEFLIRVLFVNGNYNRSGKLKDGSDDKDSGPTFKTYRIEFTEEEVEENWQMLANVAREEGMLGACLCPARIV